MPKIKLSSILIEDRQRLDLGDISSLAESIKRYGQIQPIVIRETDNRLVAGGRRCAAITSLGWDEVEYIYRENLTDSQLAELELEENIRRKNISWQEQCLAIKQIHTKKQRENAIEGKQWGHRETAEMLGIKGHSNVFTAIRVAKRLEDDIKRDGPIWKSESVSDAIRVILTEQENEAMRILNEKEREIARRTLNTSGEEEENASTNDLSWMDNLPSDVEDLSTLSSDEAKEQAREKYLTNPHNNPNEFDSYWEEKQKLDLRRREVALTIPLSKMFLNEDAIKFMSQRSEFVDHIITDIPYGIDMSMLEQEGTGMDVSSVKEEHEVEANLDLIGEFFEHAYGFVKDKGYVITWCDVMNWQYMYNKAIASGFKVQRWPITWIKTHPCMNQSAQYNYTKNTEIAIVCRKGNATLASMASECSISASNLEMKKLLNGHPFVKPFEVWEFLASKVSRPGDLIYEPFAGRGSGVISFLKMGRRVIATELQQTHYNHLIENAKQYYTRALGTDVKFV